MSHRGHHYTVDDARMIPGCVQQPRVPFAIAAGGPKMLALTARFADAWLTYGDTSYQDTTAAATEAVVRAQSEQLADACARIGRDPSELDRIYLIGNTDERPLASVDTFVDFATRYAALGFTDLVFHHPRPDDPVWTEPEAIVDQIAEVLPSCADRVTVSRIRIAASVGRRAGGATADPERGEARGEDDRGGDRAGLGAARRERAERLADRLLVGAAGAQPSRLAACRWRSPTGGRGTARRRAGRRRCRAPTCAGARARAPRAGTAGTVDRGSSARASSASSQPSAATLNDAGEVARGGERERRREVVDVHDLHRHRRAPHPQRRAPEQDPGREALGARADDGRGAQGGDGDVGVARRATRRAAARPRRPAPRARSAGLGRSDASSVSGTGLFGHAP